MNEWDLTEDGVRQELERILQSPGFVRNERLSRFLRFVVERQLEGRGGELKESWIGVAVFGRKPDYDATQDAIVRTEAGRLRARLTEYYAGHGHGDPIIIDLPKGGYRPAFRVARPIQGGVSRSRGPWTKIVVTAGLTSLAAAAAWWWEARRPESIAIAVLPLENLSHDPANDYLADGFTDEIIRELSVIDGLGVRSRTSSFALKGRPRNIRDVGNQLGVNYVLEGSILREERKLRINVQLVRVRDDSPVWSGAFNREMRDGLAIQDEISRAIINNLRLKFGRGKRRPQQPCCMLHGGTRWES